MSNNYVYLEDGEDVYDCSECGNTYITDSEQPECPSCLARPTGSTLLIESRKFSMRSGKAGAAVEMVKDLEGGDYE